MPKVIDHDERRREIVAVAKRLILRGGFEAATMRSIAAEAGFANGALKHYFPGKDSIVAATFESVLDEITTVVGQATKAEDPGERLREFVFALLPRDADNIAAGRVLLALWEYAMSNEDLADLYRRHLTQWEESFVDLLQAAYDAGEIETPPPYERLAAEHIAVTIGATVVNLMFPGGERIPDYDAYVKGFIARLG
ncbi:TetR/AcrR family transcriptional regulator [Microbacterium suaedae]|uniref:TetR/AcrR family transcriptional regulator n=1 Tax=Microbacterium suaedae TaxID=2067813 RepID=UPI000DA2649B|nr:TetR/AcrR family transcriptional regulator [Microbacterium suaedae]